MLPMFLAAVDQTLLATATPVISRELGGLRDTSWLAVAYLLASVVTVPLYGQLGDRFGRRRVLVGAIALFSLGSLGLRPRPSLGMLIAARVLQGFGGGGLMTLSQALIGEVVPPRLRARNQGYFAIIFTLASVGGPVIGGVVVHNASWRWLFLVNLPLCVLAGWRLYSLRGDDVAHRRDRPARRCRPAAVRERDLHQPVLAVVGRPSLRMGFDHEHRAGARRDRAVGGAAARRAARRAAVPADRPDPPAGDPLRGADGDRLRLGDVRDGVLPAGLPAARAALEPGRSRACCCCR